MTAAYWPTTIDQTPKPDAASATVTAAYVTARDGSTTSLRRKLSGAA